MNYYADESEWKWLFNNAIDWDTILPLYYPDPSQKDFQSNKEIIEFFEDLLSHTGKWAATKIWERSSRLDIEGAGEIKAGKTIPSSTLSEFYKEAQELGAFGLNLPEEYGGLNAPTLLHFILGAQIARGCPSSCLQWCFFTATAEMINYLCPAQICEKYIPQIVAGKISGCMCITEPGCGSDVGQIITSAILQPDGTYLLKGNKIFITNGGGGLAIVLARIKGAAEGLSGLSIFFVEQEIDGKQNYYIAKNENKMGLRGSFTCNIVFENTKAYLVGEENNGFKLMLNFMNEGRMGVASQSLGAIEACIAYAKKYANERMQFGKPIAQLPLLKRIIEDMETERDAIRVLFVDTLTYFDIYQYLNLKKHKQGRLEAKEQSLYKSAKTQMRKRTPLIKFYTTEAYTSISKIAIQVLGGHGFMKDHPVERLHRDSFGPLLYEGTAQIQALMALKDTIKYLFTYFPQFIFHLVAAHPLISMLLLRKNYQRSFYTVYYRSYSRMLSLFIKSLRPRGLKMLSRRNWQQQKNIEDIMIHAEGICQMLSYLETLEILKQHIQKSPARESLFWNYLILVKPRLEMIYCDWKIRKPS